MLIMFHVHHAEVSDNMRRRAEQALRKVARRARRPVDAVIRFQQDGSVRRVELTLHTAGGRRHVARSEDRFFGSALADAARRLGMQVNHTKRTPKARARRRARAGAA
ncbi:MAG: HPF/RaiA family ribosome-associated protein [Gemmatimonadaceae bacterium]